MDPVYGRFCDQGHIPLQVVNAVKADKRQRLNISALKPAIKREVWAVIKQEAPALMALLSTMREVVETYGGEVTVLLEDLPPRVLEITGRRS